MRSLSESAKAVAKATALLMGGLMATTPALAATTEEQLKEVQQQVTLLTQQLQLVNLQSTQAATAQTAILIALKAQVSAQSDLDKAKAQGEFAKLIGIKEGLTAVGAPPAKEGTITVSAGTAGALMLGLRVPMLDGLAQAADKIVAAVKSEKVLASSASPAASAGTAPATAGAPASVGISAAAARHMVYMGTDAQVQAALQSEVTREAIKQAASALTESTTPVQTRLGVVQPAFVTEAAAAGLVLNTLVGLEKFFRVDTAYSVYDASDEAQQILISMLHRKLPEAGVELRNLASVSIPTVLEEAVLAQKDLLALKTLHESGSTISTAAEKLPAGDAKKATSAQIDRLKADLAIAKATLDALHPALKPDGFWAYIQGRVANKLMTDRNAYLPRLVVVAKAQTIQVVEKRTWRSDKIFGRSDIQIEHRVLDAFGNFLDSGIRLASYTAEPALKSAELYTFPAAAVATPRNP